MHSEEFRYHADGLAMRGQLFYDPAQTGARPAVLVFPEAFGLGGHVLSRAERLAELGHVALACDLHGDRAMVADLPSVMRLLGELKGQPHRILARAKGALDALVARPEVDAARVAAIGYCFGGTMALELARAGEGVVGVAGFHSGLEPANPATGPIAAKVLVCIGADDPSIDRAQRGAFEQEMTAARADWQLHVYGGVVHSFTNPEADARGMPDFARYDAGADAQSWAALRLLLDETLGG